MPQNKAVFGLACRLNKRVDIQRVLNHPNKTKQTTKAFTMHICPSPYNHPRLGVIVAKKKCLLSTKRNKLRRKIKALFIQHKEKIGALDLVVIYTSQNASSQTEAQSAERLFERLITQDEPHSC